VFHTESLEKTYYLRYRLVLTTSLSTARKSTQAGVLVQKNWTLRKSIGKALAKTNLRSALSKNQTKAMH
jgi:hypothetical protein